MEQLVELQENCVQSLTLDNGLENISNFCTVIITEKIRRKDQEVARALEEKHRLVAEYYQLPFDDTELNDEGNAAAAVSSAAAAATASASIDEAISGGERDAREVLLAALVQGQFEVQRAQMLAVRCCCYFMCIISS